MRNTLAFLQRWLGNSRRERAPGVSLALIHAYQFSQAPVRTQRLHAPDAAASSSGAHASLPFSALHLLLPSPPQLLPPLIMVSRSTTKPAGRSARFRPYGSGSGTITAQLHAGHRSDPAYLQLIAGPQVRDLFLLLSASVLTSLYTAASSSSATSSCRARAGAR